MTLFNSTDFENDDVRLKLNSIVMDILGENPLVAFHKIPSLRKKIKYGEILNKYIADLNEDWETKITNDFNIIMNDILTVSTFKPENIYVPIYQEIN